MHTTRIGETTFIHNGDCSGDIIIVHDDDEARFSIPFEDLLGFVAEYVWQEKLNIHETLTPRQVLGIE